LAIASYRIQQAQAYEAVGNYKAAVDYYTQALKSDPGNVQIYNSRINAYIKLKSYDKALEDVSSLIRINANDADAWTTRAVIQAMKGDRTGCLTTLGIALSKNPHDIKALMLHAEIYVQMYDYPTAQNDYNTIIQQDPHNVTALTARATLETNQAQYQAAIKDWTTLINIANQKNPPDDKAKSGYFSKRGLLYLQVSNVIVPGTDHTDGAPLYQMTQDSDAVTKGIADFQTAIQYDSKNPEGYKGRALAYSSMGLYDLARDDYNTVLQLAPNDPDAKAGLAWLKSMGH
jgi:tetratricopeptide (TPR) repeat protein